MGSFLLILLPSLLVLMSAAQIRSLWTPVAFKKPRQFQIGGCMNTFDNSTSLRKFYHSLKRVKIPDSFDAREQWPYCSSVHEISDQGHCGSCWAFGATQAMSDRVCIHSHGREEFHFSANDLVSCCSLCDGCNGCPSAQAWTCWKENGIVSGGPYGSQQGCRPYEVSPTDPHPQTPKCVKQCESTYPTPYRQDLHFGKTVYAVPNDVRQIQREIMTNGPVAASFIVYEDFVYNFNGQGIYKQTFGRPVSGHTVKMIGWGVEDGVDYWILANSWGTGWGDNGFFRFVRGENNCYIEEYIYAGIPA